MLFLLIAVFMVMLLLEIPTLIRQRYWRELAVFLFLTLGALIPSLLLTAGFHLPSPVKAIEFVIEYILGLFR